MVFYRNLIGLVPARPNNEICIFEVLSLFFDCWSLHKLDPFFISSFYLLVKPLSITAKTRVRIHKTFRIRKNVVTEFFVSISFGLIYCSIKHSNFVPVDNLYVTGPEMGRKICIVVEVPILVLKVAPAFANAFTFGVLQLLCLRTTAALRTILVAFELRIWELSRSNFFTRANNRIVALPCGWPVKHQPGTRKSRVRCAHYYYVF